MRIDLLTIFPAILDGPFRESMLKRAQEQKLVSINLVDLREYTDDRHHQVDDAPYGGGYGMVLKPEPLFSAVEDLKAKAKSDAVKVILMTPQGRQFNQARARTLAGLEHIILICGRYEGVDERVRTALVDQELSIGDYILSGGELAAAVVVDAIVRLLPGFLAEEASVNESFTEALLEHPHYTRPAIFRNMEVPPVLLSGNHGAIAAWRRRQALKRTYERRPDLMHILRLSDSDLAYLNSIGMKKE
jgi:tRNA (guanine37-N1)-methyltransferase